MLKICFIFAFFPAIFAAVSGPFYMKFATIQPKYLGEWNGKQFPIVEDINKAHKIILISPGRTSAVNSVSLRDFKDDSKFISFLYYELRFSTSKKKNEQAYFTFILQKDLYHQGYTTLKAEGLRGNFVLGMRDDVARIERFGGSDSDKREASIVFLKVEGESPTSTVATTIATTTPLPNAVSATLWTQCSKSCERGIQQTTEKSRFCNLDVCPPEVLPRAIIRLSKCSKTCGGGTFRFKACDSCPEDTRSCNTPPCPQWQAWTSYGQCGHCFRYRRRNCNAEKCAGGVNIESQECNSGSECSSMSSYKWGACSKTCGEGSKIGTQTNCKKVRGRGRGRPTCVSKTLKCNLQSCDADLYIPEATTETSTVSMEATTVLTEATTVSTDATTASTEATTVSTEATTASTEATTVSTEATTASTVATTVSTEATTASTDSATATEGWSQCTKSCGSGSQYLLTEDCNDASCATKWQDCNTEECPTDLLCLTSGVSKHRFNTTSQCCKTQTTNSECGLTKFNNFLGSGRLGDYFSQRILQGVPSKLGQWPWMVALQIAWNPKDPGTCGGSLLNDKWVLTAAHCVSDTPKSIITATIGSLNLEDKHKEVMVHNISKIVIHAEYSFPTHDIALLELSSKVKLSQYVWPICLPGGEKPSVDQMCAAAGWGIATVENIALQKASKILMEVPLKSLDFDVCRTGYRGSVFTSYLDQDKMICAGKINGGPDTCSGDSGGPFMCQRSSSCGWYIAGLTSFGPQECGTVGQPGVYTSINAYEKWIKSIVPYGLPDEE